MYKKQLIIGIIALCWCGEIYAQPALPQIERTAEAIRALPAAKTIRTLPTAKKAKVVLKKKQLSLQLEQRAERTYELAQQSIKQYPSTAKLYGLSASKFITRPLPDFNRKDLYPEAPFLKNPQQLTDYFIARQNREILKNILPLQLHAQEVNARIEDFQNAKKEISHPAREDMRWLAGQIDKKAQYLLLGEQHSFATIQKNITDLLYELRYRQPKRKIFLFSEFIPQQFNNWEMISLVPSVLPYEVRNYFPIFRAAQDLGIMVVGLEPRFVIENYPTTSFDKDPTSQEKAVRITAQNIWASWEGMRLRNERWMETIRQYRLQYPDALFIVHAGAAHVDYTLPYSLGKALQGPATFVATLYPRTLPSCEEKETSVVSNFDKLTNGNFSTVRVLQFGNEQLSKLAGFDVQIKISSPASR